MNKVDETQESMSIRRRYATSLSVQIVLALLFGLGLYMVSSNSAPKVTHTIIPSEERLPERKVSANDLITWGQELELTPSQISQLKRVQEELDDEVRPLNRKIEKLTEEFQAELKGPKKKTSFADVTRAAKPAIDLGRKKRKVVDNYADEAMAVLTNEQQEKALVLFRDHHKQKEKEVKISDDY